MSRHEDVSARGVRRGVLGCRDVNGLNMRSSVCVCVVCVCQCVYP